MKVSVLQENLKTGLGIASRAVANRSTLPVLTNILLATENGQLKLAATDLEIGIVCRIGAKIESEGGVTVPAKLINDLVGSLPPERVDMALAEATQTLNLKCARFEQNIKGINEDEFPLLQEVPANAEPVRLKAETLREMINQVAFAAAKDESRPILTGVLVEFGEDNSLTLAAADGFRLALQRQNGLAGLEPGWVVVPARALIELQRILTDADEAVMVYRLIDRKQILFEAGPVTLVSQVIEGKFPDFTQIIPKGHATRTVLEREGFLKAVRLADLFARDGAHIIKLAVEPGEMETGVINVYGTGAEIGDGSGWLDCMVTGEPIEIAFNAHYLMQVLQALNSSQVALETISAAGPGVIRPVGDEQQYTYVIMPMHTGGN